MKTITLGELAATDKREWVQTEIARARAHRAHPGTVIPIVPNLHRQILTRIENGGELDMWSYHGETDKASQCGTTHCYAGWANFVAGPVGWKLERGDTGIEITAHLIIAASCPHVATQPDFGQRTSSSVALATIRRYAAMEGK